MKTLFTLAIFLFFPFLAYSQFGEPNLIDYVETAKITSILAGDLDGDGDLDMLSSSSNDDKIAWYKNLDGLGNFDKQIIIAELNEVQSVLSNDLDGDGDLDVIAYSEVEEKLVWYRNLDGLGNFGYQLTISNDVDRINSFSITDLDNDGDMDITVGLGHNNFNDQSDDKIIWFENINGSGNFEPQKIISLEAKGYNKVLSYDLDGDGDMDVISSSFGEGPNGIFWYENEDGLGNFEGPKTVAFSVGGIESIWSVDMDNDGDMDVVSNSNWNDFNRIAWYENEDGLGSFGPQQTIDHQEIFSQPIFCSDFDGDGDIDILSSSRGDFGIEIIWFENEDGQGNFGSQQAVETLVWNPNIIYSADLNGDGNLDLITASENNNLYWYNNENGVGDFTSSNVITSATKVSRGLVLVDFDGDGDKDALGTNYYNTIFWYENEDGYGKFGPIQIVFIGDCCTRNLKAADLDGDEDMDIISNTGDGNRVTWFENLDGFGNFGQPQIISTEPIGGRFLQTADFDGDGDIDILSNNSKLLWYENIDGQGNFELAQSIPTDINYNSSAYVVDFDADGDLDIFFPNADNNDIEWYENEDGLGTFGPKQILFSEVISPSCISVMDMDGDDDLDIAVGSYLEQEIHWLKNVDGLGNFELQQSYSTGIEGPISLRTLDIDSDGDLDMISTGHYSGYDSYDYSRTLRWYENEDGFGSFGPQKVISSSTLVLISDPACEDIDGDGDLDLLTGLGAAGPVTYDLLSYEKFNNIFWYENFTDKLKLQGTVFYDENENGILDLGEQELREQQVQLSPNALQAWTDEKGKFKFALANGDYTLAVFPSEDWESTSANPVELSIDENMGLITQNFGLKPFVEKTNFDLNLSSGPTRCDFSVPFWLSLANRGTQIANGTITLELDPLVTYMNASPEPHSINGNLLTWNISELYPTYSEKIELSLQIADVSFIGETITLITTAQTVDTDGNITFSNDHVYTSVINCSYDPNDKLVEPDFEGNDNYTLFSDSLLYTIRFQNKGTGTVFNVVIEDYLDPNLDWTTFRLIASSDPVEVRLLNNGMLEFSFQNILLPNSSVNEMASHGYVKYEISSKDGVDENTIIKNTADIFFDNNPGIITNTTKNILISTFDADGDGFTFLEDCDDNNSDAYPMAVEIPSNGIDEDCDGFDLTVSTIKLELFPIKVTPNPTSGILQIELPEAISAKASIYSTSGKILLENIIHQNGQIDLSKLSAGIYILTVQSNQERWIQKIVKVE